jgi:glycosyltransferase involved in cell wall biosynthesis
MSRGEASRKHLSQGTACWATAVSQEEVNEGVSAVPTSRFTKPTTMIKISIVIPAFNAERCLRETLESALNQTHPAHEIIVVDDGSTDRTEEIARSYGNRIRHIKQQNQGIAGARNTAVREATGDWIAFLDHDDLMLPTKLEKQLAIIEANPDLVVVYSAFTYLYADGTTKLIPAFPSKSLWPTLRYRSPILPSTSIIRRSALKDVGGFVQLCGIDDWNMWFRLIRRYSPSAFKEHPEGLTMYRWWDNNASRNFMPIAEAVLDMLDTLLLQDLKGFKRAIWRRRIEARVYYSLSHGLREIHNERYWEFAIESFLKWPFCGKMIPPYRYVVFANMLWKRLRHFSFNLRYWWPVRRCREDLTVPS